MAGGALVEDLRGQIAGGSVLVVAGAGVSVGAAGGGVASWPGLLEDGRQRVVEADQGGLPAGWGELIGRQVGSGDLSWMLAAAEEVTTRLGGRSGGEFRRWLADSVGALRVRDGSVIGALAGLGVPVATTNYDGLIEEVTGWPAVTWRDGARVQRVLRGDERGVLHLHGYWRDPESVLLGIRSYEAVLGDAAAQGLQRAMASLRSLLLVGFGAGLADPNFGALRDWLAAAFPGSEYRHFRLCRAEEFAEVAAQHRPHERVMAVSYGERHEDLAPFLRSLSGGGKPGGRRSAGGPMVSAAEQADRLDEAEGSYRHSAEGLFGRLSPSSVSALAYADGLRSALIQDEVHMEHLILGLDQEEGPAQRLLARAGIGQADLMATLTEAVGVTLPPQVVPSTLESLPPISGHVAEALDHAVGLADAAGSPIVRSRHLLHGALSIADCGVVEALAKRGIHASDIEDFDAAFPSAGPPPVRPPLLAGAAADTVPEPGDGRVRAADRLGAAAEVEMLVSVLLASDTPLPLAVGLFGDWGTGKSFFMALMYERIDELAKLAALGRPEGSPFCREVRQVRFNAWHYVDTNLWASLAATLFDELARADAPYEAQTKLTQLDEARREVVKARTRREDLERQVGELAANANRPASAMRVSASVAIRAVRDDAVRENLKDAKEGAKDGTAVDVNTVRLMSTLGEIDSAAGNARTAWRLFQEEVLHRRRWVTLATLVVLIGLGVLASVVASWPTGLKLLTFVGAVAAGLSPALSGALRVLYLAREAREARELPLVQKREELAEAQAEEEGAERDVAQREQELAELRDKGLQLREFVRERAASSDYRDKLGVISQVRRDFEQLVALVPGGQTPGAEQIAAVAVAVTQHVPDVERIVLFVDDLDRCPHEKVVEVLQAVHLLLAFKLFVVVVGVDSRWLERSLQAHYQDLLEEPESYLEKIFQIPFTLQGMTRSKYRDLIDELTPPLGQPGQRPDVPPDRDPMPARQAKPDKIHLSDGTGDIGRDRATTIRDTTTVASSGQAGQAHETVTPVEPPPLPRPEALVISDAERALLGQLGVIVQTPRAAKRLVNIYRMLRVSVPEGDLEAFKPGGGDEYQAVVMLLGILVGRPSRAYKVFTELMAADDDTDVWQVLAEFEDVYEPLATIREHLTVVQAGPYRRWAPRVSRFSFRLAAVLPRNEPAT